MVDRSVHDALPPRQAQHVVLRHVPRAQRCRGGKGVGRGWVRQYLARRDRRGRQGRWGVVAVQHTAATPAAAKSPRVLLEEPRAVNLVNRMY